MRHCYLLLFFLLLSPVWLWAQTGDTACRKMVVYESPQLLDSLTVWPESIVVTNANGQNIAFKYEPGTGQIIFPESRPGERLEICYQRLPIVLHKSYMLKSYAEYKKGHEELQHQMSVEETEYSDSHRPVAEELFSSDQIHKNGALSRGISFGNQQNLFVQSALNLQLEGMLTDELGIRASITDQQIPYQPEGNTARIQEFDNILVEVFTDNLSLSSGDIVFRNNESNFLRYNKNVQGAMFQARHQYGSNIKAQTLVGASAAKGQFASLEIEAIEGVSGPYRIRIPGASPLSIILANSEQVFIDGRRMQRGFQNDYIIDYNRAEITFMPGVLITRFTRIRIDVEYSDQQYSRSIITASHEVQTKKWSAFVNYYNEKDNRFRPLGMPLDFDQMQILSEAGNDPLKAVTSGAVESEYMTGAVLYERIDTLDSQGQPIYFYRHSNDRNARLFQVSFYELGQGQGNYRLRNTVANGRVYEWVPPVNGIPQGRFEPLRPLKAPDQKQMITAGGSYKISEKDEVFTEIAFSDHDQNLFSSHDQESNQGMAIKTGYRALPRKAPLLKKYQISGESSFEWLSKNFRAIDRFRDIEFDRDWSVQVPIDSARDADRIWQAALLLQKDAEAYIKGSTVNRMRGDWVSGWQHRLDAAQKLGNFRITGAGFLMHNATEAVQSDWRRLQTGIQYHNPWLIPGYTYAMDHNALYLPGTDYVQASAMYFDEHIFSLKTQDSLKTTFSLDYSLRTDQTPQEGMFVPFFRSKTTNARIQRQAGTRHTFDALFTYRHADNVLSQESPSEETVMGRVNWNANVLKGHLQSELSYGLGNGREMRRDFFYVQVPAGQGTHTWRDDNGDGIQDLNEFYPAINPDERNYIRIMMPTDEFVFAYENQLNYRINADMPKSWDKKGGISAFMSKFSLMSALNASRKVSDENIWNRLVPLGSSVADENIMHERTHWRSILFFNRRNTRYGAEGGYSLSNNRQLHLNGFEARNRENSHFRFRYNPSQMWNFLINMSAGHEDHGSDFLSDRNFTVVERKFLPEMAWQQGTKLRLSTQLAVTRKFNPIQEQGEFANWNEAIIEMRYSGDKDYMFTGRFRVAEIQFEGQEQSPMGYVLLEALRPGTNLTWNLVMQKRLINGLQIMLQYDGRKSEGLNIIHMANVQVSALF